LEPLEGTQKRKVKDKQPIRTKKRERVNPSRGRKSPTVPLMSFACKWCDLIVMGGLEQASLVNAIFLSITKAKAS
jgi:hypothetical protein